MVIHHPSCFRPSIYPVNVKKKDCSLANPVMLLSPFVYFVRVF